ncbi:type II toxin-antitoxin system RelE/ParE family toxin [Granulicella sibirica]|uniref:Plasmid stabilization system protein n=1 Tax=Granulicella sibirica TaxID=2479048 RepID=A0A4Q0T3P3_9BACT|nr:type II toxin-antitoxin system RelE/ParE family toxin [Granulicella sibirica]RXH57522.1 Plasmid stabilization system protein [Granulicella sibirica]
MNLPVVWLPEAVAELKEAAAWYSNVRPELGIRFAQAIDATMENISANPLLFAVADRNRRRAGVRRFPYGIFFIDEPNRIVVIACFHGKRNPRHWKTRPSNPS